MRDLLLGLLRHFMTPDPHESDPAGFVVTQAAHFGAIGAPACWLALVLGAPSWLAVLVVAVGYAAVEVVQSRFGAQTLSDALMDWAFVVLGAVFLLGATSGAIIVAAAGLLLAVTALLSGVIERTGPSSGS